jgi:predicted metalloprotease with PDZ domain
MKRFCCLLYLILLSVLSIAQTTYTLTYADSTSASVKVTLQPASPLTAPISFVMPRSIPGAYDIATYDQFIDTIYVTTVKGTQAMMKDRTGAPRWYYSDTGISVNQIEYELNLERLERKTSPSDASIIRPGFVGILNYSVFGWIDGLELQHVKCHVQTLPKWPIFSSSAPSVTMEKGDLEFDAENYYTLADGQVFIGPRFRIKEFKGIGQLFIASYCQTGDEYLDDYGWQGVTSMSILQQYFGELPFKQYSIFLSKVLPLEPRNSPSLGMEHLQSSTFFGDTSGFRKTPMTNDDRIRTMPTFLHHMAHAFIPLRCYGDAYRPHVLEIPPIINDIWFNEGFMWFLPFDTLKFERMKTGFYNSVYNTSPYIKKLSLTQLSQSASTMYGTDFRLGRAVYSRGALMAIEMNDYLKEKTRGQKSMKDVLRYLYEWSKQNKRPFTMDEFPLLVSKACNIDLSGIYQKWQRPVE